MLRNKNSTKKFLIVGSGLSGAVLAHELAENLDCQIEIWEEREHIAGNCYTSEDPETGIMVHRYGPHIFNTDKEHIWKYVNRFAKFRHFVHWVKAMHKGKIYSLPVNLDTLNSFFGKTFTPASAREWLESKADRSIIHPANFEEQAMRTIGKELYYAFFYGYTKKQWGCEPRELPASVLKRLPIRFNFNYNYHVGPYTGIPEEGYTRLVENILDHSLIELKLSTKFSPEADVSRYDHIFYTGPLDAFFNHEFGRLGYRTLTFEEEIHEGDYQGTVQMNFGDEDIPYTRITEPKHFTPWKQFEKTIIIKEFSRETQGNDTPYYPKRLAADKQLLRKYRAKAETLTRISFLGRLGTYRYLDMDDVIAEALDFSKTFALCISSGSKPPIFPNEEAAQSLSLL